MSGEIPERHMRRAIQLSRRGFPAPNPRVGCVIAHGEAVAGEGWHAYAGGPHAEAAALARAGQAARGADVYVTLEPCAHHGRTPPCADALLLAGVRRVFIATSDPNPQAAGGAGVLRQAGVEVHVGLLEREAAGVSEPFLLAHRLGRPYVTLKAATTLDGFIARPDGSSKWITGPAARRAAHRLRAGMGAVLTGRRTVEIDDPRLTVRLPGARNQPLRVVLDPQGRLGPEPRVFREPGEAWHVVAAGCERSPRHVPVAATETGLDLADLLARLWAAGQTGLLVEGGAHTLRTFLEAGLADRIDLFVAPVSFGAGLRWLADGPPLEHGFHLRSVRRLGPDLQLSWAARRLLEPSHPEMCRIE
jgi:diaminohydroxyphosphoribosylaminopyrimidine deaminase/5-amino-6-(5-phosphoribosylamino)uracil reductase